LRVSLLAFNNLSLTGQFLVAGGLVTLFATLSIGAFVTDLISKAVTQNTAAATALYVDSVIAPILPDMATTEQLDEAVERALDETLSQGALASRLLSFRLWRGDGTVLYSNDKTLMGKRIRPDDDLREAFSGRMVAEFELDHDEDPAGAVVSDEPILEIYNPIHQPWSGEVVAVAEFYERAIELNGSLASARIKSWLAVMMITASFFLILSFIVVKASKTIESQKTALNERVEELGRLLVQNRELAERVQRASQRTTALNERFLRRVGADLHDGPVQLMSYASMRIDSPTIRDCRRPEPERLEEVDTIKQSLDQAIQEVRNICRGLVLPEIETLPLEDLLERVVLSHTAGTGADVELISGDVPSELPPSARICIYRFVQEALTNGWKHAEGKGQRVEQWLENGCVVIAVSDLGPGFDPNRTHPEGLGLSGLKERIESLGGRFEITTSSAGTKLTMSLKICELEAA
jgi:signal transduction histidine kinase